MDDNLTFLCCMGYIVFCLAFVLMMSVKIYPMKKIILSASILLACTVAFEYALHVIPSEEYFIFFYPVTCVMVGTFFTIIISEFAGFKAIFPLIVGIFFVTIADTVGDTVRTYFNGNAQAVIMTEAGVLLVAIILVGLFVKPFYVTTAKYSDKGWGMVDLSLFIYLVMVFLMSVTTDFDQIQGIRYGLELIMLIVFISICVFSARSLRTQEAEYNQKILDEHARANMMQAAEFREGERKLSILKHDMRHRVGMLSHLIREGHTEEALRVLEGMSETLDSIGREKYCDNVYINAVFSMHVRNAESRNIRLDIRADIPEDIPIDSTQLAVVLSNLIENALKAAAKLEEEEKRIVVVRVRDTGSTLALKVVNSCVERAVLDSSGFPTTTEKGHGIGYLSVQSFIEQNKAAVDFAVEDDKFAIKILINY